LGNDATKAALTTLTNPVQADKAKTMGAANQMLVATESLVLAAK
jgi:hypothetical protein